MDALDLVEGDLLGQLVVELRPAVADRGTSAAQCFDFSHSLGRFLDGQAVA